MFIVWHVLIQGVCRNTTCAMATMTAATEVTNAAETAKMSFTVYQVDFNFYFLKDLRRKKVPNQNDFTNNS